MFNLIYIASSRPATAAETLSLERKRDGREGGREEGGKNKKKAGYSHTVTNIN